VFRKAKFQVYHTREGHRPDLSTLPSRERFRSRNGGAEIGSPGPLGRFLLRGEEGHDIVPELYPIVGELVIDKPMRSAFNHTDFDLLLRNRGIRNLVVGGVTADVCVLSTVKDAIDRGYDVLLLKDGCAAAESNLLEAVINSVQMEGGIAGAVGRVEDVVSLLRGLEVTK
jgi:nicotinamidase-related amidase